MTGKLLKLPEAAKEMKCSVDSVRRMIKAGQLQVVKIGSGTMRASYRVIADSITSQVAPVVSSCSDLDDDDCDLHPAVVRKLGNV